MATNLSTRPDYSNADFYEVGSPQHTADTIARQDAQRAQSAGISALKTWAPWLIGGLVVGGGAYLLLRD